MQPAVKRFSLILAILCLTLAGCGSTASSPPVANLPTVQMAIGKSDFTLEVADNAAKREQGLMQRDSMPSSHGMIFVFPDETDRAFWMKNTRIPLDIVFLDHNGKIVSLATMKPYDLSNTPSNGPAKYAIELNAGEIQSLGLQVGQILSIPTGASSTKE